MIFKRISFWLAVLGILGLFSMIRKMRQDPPVPPPLAQPTRSPYTNSVAATGIIEATRENVKVAASKSGLVQKVFVEVGSNVKTGDPLFQLDDRESRAKLATARAQLGVLKAMLATEKVQLADMTDQFERVSKLAQQKVASEDERLRKQ